MRIKSHAPLIYVGMMVAGLITLAIMGIYIYAMWRNGRDRWFVYAFVSPFVLVGFALAFFGARVLYRQATFGSWQLEVPGNGGALGHPCDVTLFPTRTRTVDGELTCHLRCIRIRKLPSMRNSNGRSDITTLWETTWTTRAGTVLPNIGLPLRLPLPASGEPTNISPQTGAGTQWQLNVVVPTRGFNDESVFDLPVRV